MLSPVTARTVHPICVKTVRVGSQKSVDQTHRREVGLFVEKRVFFHEEDCGPLWEWEKRLALRKEWPTTRIEVQCPELRSEFETAGADRRVVTGRPVLPRTHGHRDLDLGNRT